ncbi:hypothetical protein DICVIV_13822 [Dictyocaulus viviparus]|uniref:Uncharacterized protein n=1 Tax=Dictyocaulus viviparus TaxID=29172 RepID=A0A0D8X921_DICVI|nr:hypothetical protein DICVIV_13822 [Dictyocaulus viviparus]
MRLEREGMVPRVCELTWLEALEGLNIVSIAAAGWQSAALTEGMNRFLKMLEITFRRDTESYRPRINKKDSIKDMEQKKSGQFLFIDEA